MCNHLKPEKENRAKELTEAMSKRRRRGNGEGSITLRADGRYQATYYEKTVKGPKRRYVYGKTRREASDKMVRGMARNDGGLAFDAGKLTVGEYLDRWLDGSMKDTVTASTFERYEQVVRLHLQPILGKNKLKDLNSLHVQGLYREKLNEGLSAATVRKVHNALHKALVQAVRWSLVPNNATDGAQAPKPRAKEVTPLNNEQAKALLEAARGDRLEALYVTALTTGARKGELLALKWDDLDLERGLLRIRRSITRVRGRFELGETKNKEGREIELTARAVAALKAHRKRQLEERLELAGLWEDRGLVFATQRGTLINPSNLRRSSFAPLLKETGLPPAFRFHDLRHTCATLLLKERARPKEVQSLLGHKTIAMTMNTYGHLIPGMGKETAEAMERALM